MKKLLPAWFVTLMVAIVVVSCGGDGDDSTPQVTDGVTEVVRQLLAEASPDTAQGQLLELTRVIIPPNGSIAPHTHPGPQLAIIVLGTITYTVIDGEATVTRAAASDDQEIVTYTSGDTLELRAGDSIFEPTGMVHRASNETKEPVVIYLSSLFPAGAPPATTVQ